MTTQTKDPPLGAGATLSAGAESSAPSVAHGVAGFADNHLVAERYRVIRFLGRGGMGEVYEAEDLALGTRVALKTIRPARAGDEQVIERFKQEILLARRVAHPNVCRVFDVGFHGAVTFLTMELLVGETLAERIARSGRLSTDAALPLVRQMAAALDAAHRSRVIHRDFKSGNVLLVTDAAGTRAVVTDFGLARAVDPDESLSDSLSGSGEVIGTPAYMAPEQVEGTRVTPLADIYALGVVMYEMVTGKRPFVGRSPFTVALQRLKQDPAPPEREVPGLDPRWSAAILRCMAREPERRFAAALDVAEALEAAVAPTRALRWWVLTIAAVAVAAAGALGWARIHRAASPAIAPPLIVPGIAPPAASVALPVAPTPMQKTPTPTLTPTRAPTIVSSPGLRGEGAKLRRKRLMPSVPIPPAPSPFGPLDP